ncbi:SKP1-like protein 4 [Euphorbia lathyris]|uniref:SKP1-like protein 4 n=1 Tax=Euphorbia lathyris TaxID=212925 RepID=UPI0033134DA0
MSSSSSTKKVITLKSSDNKIFKVEESVALLSKIIKQAIELDDHCADSPILLSNITGPVLDMVIRYCTEQLKNPEEHTDNKTNHANFVKEVTQDQNMLFDLILAADYLEINSLLDLLCKAVADMMKGKSVEQIREIFNIKNNYTEEEIEEIKRENSWAFE